MADIPEGELFSRLYVKPGAPARDSERLRRRITGYFQTHIYFYESPLMASIGSELHIEVGAPFTHPITWSEMVKFFHHSELADFLSGLTVIYRILNIGWDLELADLAGDWRAFVKRSLEEENVNYRVDSKCGLHPKVDQEFECSVVSTLAVLTSDRYRAVRHAADSAFKQLDTLPMDGKGATRNMYEAAESLVKIILETNSTLGEGLVNKDLRRVVDRLFESDPQLKSTAGSLVSSFGSWVAAVQPSRHGHDRDQPLMLPADVAILCVSQGAAFLRWLVDVDQRKFLV